MDENDGWRWWEQANAPDYDDLWPQPDDSGCVAVIAVLLMLVLLAGVVTAIVLS